MSMTNFLLERHVAVLAFPFTSHPGLLLELVRRLAAAAPDTTFSFYSTAKSNDSLFSTSNTNNIKPFPIWDGVPDGYVFSGNIEDNVNFNIAEEMGVPWVPLWVGGACSLSVHYYTDLIRNTIGIHEVAGRENELLKFLPGFSELRLGDLPDGVLFGNLESPFSIMLHKMGQALPKAAAVLLNSFEELDPDIIKDLNSKFRKVLNVGPFSLMSSPSSSSNVDEYGCIPWLDEHKADSVAYIGFGTMLKPSPIELVALAEALEASGTPFLWSLGEESKGHLPEGFLKRTSEQGKIVPWAPRVQVLAHGSTGVYITHCGWGSVMESIAAGMPMIGRPFFADNHINAWMVENVWKIGVRVEGGVFTRSGTMRALELVLSNEKGKKFKDQIGHLRELALKAVEPKGSSSENFKTLLDIVTGHNL
ncbi:UDP-glucosyl transferase 78D1 [Actinidia rufa]|uniref:UDP-glucosyl transferase 78D1 n=1 Tax=Actinidia rufa TaxID=165716 RepID=A0A7J0G0W8_9ERIC|nr:UDP-glucosyl transferase 78D1 [Actinidia rufa]